MNLLSREWVGRGALGYHAAPVAPTKRARNGAIWQLRFKRLRCSALRCQSGKGSVFTIADA